MTNGPNELDDLLSAYHDGELTAAERQTVDRLLQDSVDARAELEDYQTISTSLKSLPRERAPEGFRREVINRINQGEGLLRSVQLRSSSKKRRSKRAFLAVIVGGLVTAACVFVAFQGQLATNGVGDRTTVARTEASARAVETMSVASDAPGPSELGGDADELQESEDNSPGESSYGMSGGLSGIAAADAAVGDVYSYFDQTDDGDVVVVEATVVDVRRAINQLQVLFVNNSIQTTTVGFGESEELRSTPEPVEPHSEWAIYVESDQSLIDKALEQLRDQVKRDEIVPDEATVREQVVQEGNAFVDLKLAGTIDSPDEALDLKGITQVEQLRNTLNQPFDAAAARSRSRSYSFGSDGESGRDDRPQARFSVPAEAMSRGAALEPSTPLRRLNEAPEAEVKERSLNYQAVVNVSKSQIDKQLQTGKPATPLLEDQQDEELAQRRANVERDAGAGAGLSSLSKETKDFFALKQSQRRGRMLVVLQSWADAKADRIPQPVEALRPQPR